MIVCSVEKEKQFSTYIKKSQIQRVSTHNKETFICIRKQTEVFVRERLRCDEEPTVKHRRRGSGSYLSIQRKYWIWGSDRCPSRTLLHAALMKEKKRRRELHALHTLLMKEEKHARDAFTSELWAKESQRDTESTRAQTSDGMHSMNEEESIVGDGGKHEETTSEALRKKISDDDDDEYGFH